MLGFVPHPNLRASAYVRRHVGSHDCSNRPAFRSAAGNTGCQDPCNDTGHCLVRKMANDGLNKFKRYRISKQAKGMKLLRPSVPDPTAPGFAQEARRQAALLRGAPEETEALNFIEAVADTEG